MKTTTKLLIGLGALAVISPIGLYLPGKFKAGDAWGEWDAGKIKELVGYIPTGFQKLSSLWNAWMPDYSFKGWEDKGLAHMGLAYIVSAIVGIALCAGGAYLLGKILARKKTDSKHEGPA
jgi:cobalt/nickel transport protein